MRVTVLGSGSDGNATLVECGATRILVDAGFSGRSIERRLEAVDVAPESLQAIVVTHEHRDHTRGAGVLARRFGTPLLLTRNTREACTKLFRGDESIGYYEPTRAFTIGDLEIQPFLTAHDAVDPVAITLRDPSRGHKLGIATDLGRPTASVKHALADCHLLILEANHDEAMLRQGPYPWSVKQRIASSHGHLSNRAAAEFARDLTHPGLGGVVLAHLSERCNDAGLASDVVGRALEDADYRGTLRVARQDIPIEPVEIARIRRAVAPPQLSLL